jgi:hypothetical protein
MDLGPEPESTQLIRQKERALQAQTEGELQYVRAASNNPMRRSSAGTRVFHSDN